MKVNLLIIPLLMTHMFNVAGCDSSTTTSSAQENPNPKHVSSHTYKGKPAAPVQLEYQIHDEPQTGIPLSISLTIIPAVTANSVSMNLKASSELLITDGISVFELNNLVAGQAVVRTIEVLPQSDGKHHLLINVYIDSASGRSGTRSFSIMFITGNIETQADLPGAVQLQPSDQGEKLMIQKGVETRTVEP